MGLARKGREVPLEDLRHWGKEKPVRAITKAPALFPRIEAKAEEALGEETMAGSEKSKTGEESKVKTEKHLRSVPFAEFQKLDLRVGTINKAKVIPGSKKLLKLSVDIGEERTVVAGLVGHYTEAELTGKQVVLVANLEPIKLMGVESHGMVLAAEDGTGVHLLVPDAKTTPGSKVR